MAFSYNYYSLNRPVNWQENRYAPHSLHKLVCSLRSGLPNEIDFAMHVSTLLANNDAVFWSDDYRLVDAICDSLQVFVCLCQNQEEAKDSCYCYIRFWHKLFSSTDLLHQQTQHQEQSNSQQQNHENNDHNLCQQEQRPQTPTPTSTSPPPQTNTPTKDELIKLEIFKISALPSHTLPQYMRFDKLTKHETKDHMRIYYRIKHVAELLRQISLTAGKSSPKKRIEQEEEIYNLQHQDPNYQQTRKKRKLCASGSLLKFTALLLFCDDIAFKDIGLDIIANVTPKLSKLSEMDDPNSHRLIGAIHTFCVQAINQENGDIYTINRCLEIVSKLLSSSSHKISSKTAALMIENNLVSRLEQLLTCQHDVTLFLSALECCYHISQHQPQLFVDSDRRYLIKLLINLLNCDAHRYFTPSALKRIKLIDERFDLPDNGNNYTTPHTSAPIIHTSIQQLPATLANRSATPAPNSSQVLCRLLRILEFVCDWDGCKKTFSNPKQVYSHVFETHINPLPNDSMTSCLWSGPSGVGPGCRTKRPKYSLLTHLNDFHCNPVVLQQCAMRTQQLATTGSTAIQPPVKPPEHPGYAPNAALMAIKRHASTGLDINGTDTMQPQSPLSISVRLTSALILRNLASGSECIKQALEGYEPVLSEICVSNGRDESKTVAECLGLVYYTNDAANSFSQQID